MTLPDPHVETVDRWQVVRDDLLPGGTKVRALPALIDDDSADEFVYAGPAYGYAQVALGHACRSAGRRATCFVPARSSLHPRSTEALAAGTRIVEVRHGRLSVLKARARDYCAATSARLLPFGLDTPAFVSALAAVARPVADPAEVWCVAGSGALTRALQEAWPAAAHHAVVVGASPDVGRAVRWHAPEPFERDARRPPPYPATSNYDAKVWQFVVDQASPGALIWNVAA